MGYILGEYIFSELLYLGDDLAHTRRTKLAAANDGKIVFLQVDGGARRVDELSKVKNYVENRFVYARAQLNAVRATSAIFFSRVDEDNSGS